MCERSTEYDVHASVCSDGRRSGLGVQTIKRETTMRMQSNCAIVQEEDLIVLNQDNIEIGRSFQLAVSSHDWVLAESFIPLADSQRLNDGLCIALDSIWFLR
jgi:hypothetical protein